MRTIELTIPGFSGFYESIWYAGMADEGERRREDGLKYWDHWCWNEHTMDRFANVYSDEYLSLVNRVLGLHLKKDGEGRMYSPKEYNFSTDKIYFNVNLSEADVKRIIKLMKKHIAYVAKKVYDNHTSCSGFISFMSNDCSEWMDEELYYNSTYKSPSLYVSYALHYLLGAVGEGHYDEFFFETWGYEAVGDCVVWDELAEVEFAKYLDIVTTYGERAWDAEKFEDVDEDEVARICRLKRFEKENQLSLFSL